MADLAKELEKPHTSVACAVRERIDNGGYDDEGSLKPTSNDDLRVALQLLKQNSITANMNETVTAEMKAQMAGKLDFSALKAKAKSKGKVVPIAGSDEAAKRLMLP